MSGEERLPPGVLDQKPGQAPAPRPANDPPRRPLSRGRPARQIELPIDAGPGGDRHRCADDADQPSWPVRVAEPDHERLSGKRSCQIHHDQVGRESETEGPEIVGLTDRATRMPSPKLLRLETIWSATPQPTRRAKDFAISIPDAVRAGFGEAIGISESSRPALLRRRSHVPATSFQHRQWDGDHDQVRDEPAGRTDGPRTILRLGPRRGELHPNPRHADPCGDATPAAGVTTRWPCRCCPVSRAVRVRLALWEPIASLSDPRVGSAGSFRRSLRSRQFDVVDPAANVMSMSSRAMYSTSPNAATLTASSSRRSCRPTSDMIAAHRLDNVAAHDDEPLVPLSRQGEDGQPVGRVVATTGESRKRVDRRRRSAIAKDPPIRIDATAAATTAAKGRSAAARRT